MKLAPSHTSPDGEKAAKKRDRYSKLAMDEVQASRNDQDKSKWKDYPSEFKRLMAEDPEKIGA